MPELLTMRAAGGVGIVPRDTFVAEAVEIETNKVSGHLPGFTT
jgi:hypothetical protein